MSTLHTVRGPVDSSQIGLTLIHEHVLYQSDDSKRQESIDFAVKLLQDAQAVGIQTIVELTPVRRIDWFMEIAARTAVNIVPCTGYYVVRRAPKPYLAFSEDQMVERMVRELTEGIDTTHVRAGIIKLAGQGPQLTPLEEQIFAAGARAQLKTGACIATHAIYGARAQADALLRAGADLRMAFFSHIEAEFGWEGRTVKEEAAHLATIARDGGSLLFNNFGFEFDTPWQDLVYLLHYLCDAGYQDKVLVSIDVNWTWNKEGKIEMEAEAEHPECARRTYAYMVTDTVPALQAAGFSERDIHTFLFDNPRRFFERSTLV